MKKLIVMVGPSGSGKSTKASYLYNELESSGVDAIIVSRDKIRELLFGLSPEAMTDYYKNSLLSVREYKVSEAQDTLIKQALRENKTVIVDNTHLKASYLNDLKKYEVPMEYIVSDDSKEICIMRDKKRVRTVGKDVINKQFQQFESLKLVYEFEHDVDKLDPIIQDSSLPDAFIFDIDGTLAKMKERSPYDMSRVQEDSLNYPVFAAYKAAYEAGYKIIICTGRSGTEEGLYNTFTWLADNNIVFHDFNIRPEGNNEGDWKIKEAMWRNISKEFNIVAMYDDRNQVVKHARRLGLTVFQVDEGDF